MSRPAAPRVFFVAPGLPFVDALAKGLWERCGGDPLELSRPVVLLPTRRGCRWLRDAFLRLTEGRPLLLPRMGGLGELDEDELALTGPPLELPPAVPPLRRQLLLARLIQARGAGPDGHHPSCDQAAQLAAELGRLLDQVQTEGLSFGGLKALVPDDYAAHWQITLQFLEILTAHWPAILAEHGFMDAAERRARLTLAQAGAWKANPPDHPVIVAGSTGSIPATARLIETVAGLPQGLVVLPGLDRDLDAASWRALAPSHPQYGLKLLCQRLELDPLAIPSWTGQPAPRPGRAWLVSQALRPAATTEAWRALPRQDPAETHRGVRRIDCPTPREEAATIALLLREALETPDRTAALVTPDRDLARRVAAELRRWGLEIDDSSGQPLHLSVAGIFLRLVAGMVAEDFAPHATLAALKHPYAAGGGAAVTFRVLVRRLETMALRGPRPAGGVAGLRAAITHADRELDDWLARLERLVAPLAGLMARERAPLAELVRAHAGLAEALAADDRHGGAARLWSGGAGEAAADFVADLLDAAPDLGEIAPADYPGLFETLMTGRIVRVPWGVHPRLFIWGTIEARLQQTDLMVLGGLNEGIWPPAPAIDPWMSRPMRERFGLPSPERRIGLSAHDFTQAFCAPEVVMTRSLRVDGTPTVPSRWLLRLDTVLDACAVPSWPGGPHLAWALERDRPQRLRPGRPPAPRPPLAARPRQLSATQIETWMRDPYAIYARHILRLRALDPIDADPGAADYGEIVHSALERFLKAYPDPARPPFDTEAELLRLGAAAFGPALATPGIWAFWWPRFTRIAKWVAGQEEARRPLLAAIAAEVTGRLELAGPAGPFTVTAKADRIETTRDGGLVIIDYKTGLPPSKKEVAAGFAPQLPIEAAIARAGGFPGIAPGPVADLLYWRLKGGDPGGEEGRAGDDAMALADTALAGLSRLIEAFDQPDTPYAARPHPEMAPRFSDYLHLARVKEWAALDGDGE